MDKLTYAPFHNNPELFDELKNDFQMILNTQDLKMSEYTLHEKMKELCKWLSTSPRCTVFRINTILSNIYTVRHSIEQEIFKLSQEVPEIETYSELPELIIVKSWNDCISLDLEKHSKKVIVDEGCGAAVLRGAQVFAPGILGIPYDLRIGDTVSIYTASSNYCKKGVWKVDLIENKLFIGNGILKMKRDEIFGHNIVPSGIAVAVTSVISRVPQLNDSILPKGHLLLQNLPSIICSRILDPKPYEIILDMCAAPGNKTTHIAQLMDNKGILVALEKNKNKVEKLKIKCEEFGLKNVHVYCTNSVSAVCNQNEKDILSGPPFSKGTFTRILLDGPCSALGQRPQINNKMKVSELRSFPALQKKLFATAVDLLKPGGVLVYSTCTITVAENEQIVAWALKTYHNLTLISIPEKLNILKLSNVYEPGFNISNLSHEQSLKLCRFNGKCDTVGFFIACFEKVC